MSAGEKEKILIELREYHVEEFSDFSTSEMKDLLIEFRKIEDSIINMLLSLVNGKSEFVDFSSELDKFEANLNGIPETTEEEKAGKNLFKSKIVRLRNFLAIGSTGTFTLRKSHPNKITGKQVTTTNTKQ
ncbi:MAG: hypothetical protein M3Q64_03600 [bacterium]|nr:hypothetical protein [bacterium]